MKNQSQIKHELQVASSSEELSIFEFAIGGFNGLAKSLHIPYNEAEILAVIMFRLALYWISAMADQQRARIAPEILDRYEIPPSKKEIWEKVASPESSLYALRDLINSHLPSIKPQLTVDPFSPRKLVLTAPDRSDVIGSCYLDVMREILQFQADDQLRYSLCQQCSKPFRHKSKRALYCSASCRVAASRARK